jgi:plastocyanin
LIRWARGAVLVHVRMRSLVLPSIVALVVLVVGLALGQSRPPAATAKPSTVVESKTAKLKVSNYAFVPASLTVRAGTRITVTNTDQTAHTVTARSGAFDSGTVNLGKARSFTIAKPGVYAYYCQFHAFMTGTITVVK